MALHRVITRLAAGGGTFPDAYKWSYVWYMEAADPASAALAGATLWVAHLRKGHNEYAYCYEVYASDLVQSTTLFTTLGVTPAVQRGLFDAPTEFEAYNPSIVVRVDLNVTSGRPSRKFHRVPLLEGDVGSGGRAISNGALTAAINEAYEEVVAFPGLRDESGNTFSGWSIQGLTTRRLGRDARNDLPSPPSFG